MGCTCNATAERNGVADSGAAVAPELLTVTDLAARHFVPHSVDEVAAYCSERQNSIN